MMKKLVHTVYIGCSNNTKQARKLDSFPCCSNFSLLDINITNTMKEFIQEKQGIPSRVPAQILDTKVGKGDLDRRNSCR